MSLGSIVYKVRSRFAHGLRVAYWRDVMRPRILSTAPILDAKDKTAELHVLTSGQDWLNLIWALKSFYRASGRHYALCIHEDGSLSQAALDHLRNHFPAARLIIRKEADQRVFQSLESFPRCLDFRKTNRLSPKVFDFVEYLQSDRMLLFDSDLLFFDEPRELLRRIEDPAYRFNSVNADIQSAYTVEPALARTNCNIDLIARFNSGLGLIHRDSLRRDWIEELLAIPGIIGTDWRIEQTIYALCSSRWGVELLPAEYDVHLGKDPTATPVRHYVGAIRHLMYSEGMRRLVRSRAIPISSRGGRA